MSTKADRRGWFCGTFLMHFHELNIMYKLVSLPSHLGNWDDVSTKLLALTILGRFAGLSEEAPKSKNKCSFLWATNTDS